MRRKHLIFAVAFSLLIGSFIAFVAVSEQKTLGQLVAEKDKAFRDLYSPSNPKGAWAVYSDAFDVLDAQIQRVIAELEKQRGIIVKPANKLTYSEIYGIL